ncbi:acetyl-CoA carboxylase biotin carboxyl carrier protein [Desemzia sp. RIT804]|uniref:acetyl-CoA carboxylase biotin carboxyl carrier protein n=1 Tax=Desemzia sp. RIT 804 TaxID=2810209 RepID=UPI00194EFB71|nr:acetyl-CoA carboxylase biotin carboxyl carrier protein [Desemzia sp. RIT 804]MBM6613941.1 acetyl-CoA carboxylase biotin carboxyl carrier protein [Desemzia sp. RIT 804]
MDFNQVKELLHLVDQSSLKEFHLQMDNVMVQMSKNSSASQLITKDTKTEATKPVENGTVYSNESSYQSVTETVTENAPVAAGEEILSPIVGVVYLSPEPGKPEFKKVGDSIKVGETLCIVEAMKVMNEIKSEIDGTIAEILIEDSQVVEYNQPLFRIV